MARADVSDVEAIIETNASLDVLAFIEPASSLVDYVESQDANDVLSTTLLKQIETWLAAHFYALRDQAYQSKSTEKASATFQGRTDLGFDSTYWGQTAMRLDVTGTLSRLNSEAKTGSKRRVQMYWLGKAKSDQIDYEDRD